MQPPFAYVSYTDSNLNEFIIDSGASAHMFNFKNDLTYYRRVYYKQIAIANNNKLDVVGKGDYGILKGVLYVPGLSKNLISVSKLTQDGYSILFTDTHVELRHKSLSEPIILGTLTNNLYVSRKQLLASIGEQAFVGVEEDNVTLESLPTSVESDIFLSHKWDVQEPVIDAADDLENIQQIFTNKEDLTIDLLHRRFGHVDVNKIKQLLRRSAVDGLEIKDDCLRPKHYCEHCIIAKSTVHTMHKEKSSTTLPSKRIRRINKDLYFEVVTSD